MIRIILSYLRLLERKIFFRKVARDGGTFFEIEVDFGSEAADSNGDGAGSALTSDGFTPEPVDGTPGTDRVMLSDLGELATSLDLLGSLGLTLGEVDLGSREVIGLLP